MVGVAQGIPGDVFGLKDLSRVCSRAGLKTSDRTEAQNDWMQGKVSTIVATISFGMGVDKPNVR